MTKIIIVAGGLATRMRPITEDIPKCLIDINGKPLIEHQINFFKKHGYKEFIFCVAHLAQKVKDYFKDGKDFGVKITYVEETKELMGTAGSVKLVEDRIGNDETFIVYYGDNLTNMDFGKLLHFHKEKHAIATIVTRPQPDGYTGSSVITMDSHHKIKVFLEKPTQEQIELYHDEKKYINNGIYVFNKEVFKMIPENKKYDFAKEVFPKIMTEKDGLFCYPTKEFFREIGRVEKYNAFLEEIKGKNEFL